MSYITQGLLELLGNIEEPFGLLYTSHAPKDALTPSGKGHGCILNTLRLARMKHKAACFAAEPMACMGGSVYLGFLVPPPERICHYVTTGWPGFEGERYLPSPDSMRRFFSKLDLQPAPAPYCVIKPLSMFGEDEEPLLIIFHCRGEALTGLCQLAYFALDDPEAVVLPFGSGCSSLTAWPLYYQRQGVAKAVLGGTDPSCRPFLGVDELTFTVPLPVLKRMEAAAPNSFLTGKTWQTVQRKIAKSHKAWSTGPWSKTSNHESKGAEKE